MRDREDDVRRRRWLWGITDVTGGDVLLVDIEEECERDEQEEVLDASLFPDVP